MTSKKSPNSSKRISKTRTGTNRRTPRSETTNHPYTVYVLRCNDGTFYTGITTDMKRRLREHNGEGARGAKYTKSRRPVTLVYSEVHANRSSASKREHILRHLTRREKFELVGIKLTAKS